MKLHIFVATTQGLVAIQNITTIDDELSDDSDDNMDTMYQTTTTNNVFAQNI